ncbi:SLC13 family permease [Engelhardtia mirabilis]|uniref:Sodium-dependent dicarboxylate transporter SdcS n=1 Tax=Engelhardtia mirabilis TaxID=2528011 RepID=A0A518BP88_9BACT|nr:Sodium-dependent dicarboxylate transporter SdcS [Planctomycetes bacterium Pla133]QDV03093.1 Sodium-dependent dicarboxylate transporter SdcS [Planctomycetes bacterium Pla86]
MDANLEALGSGSPGRAARAGLWVGPLLAGLLLFTPGLPLDPLQRRAAAVTALVATWWLTEALPIGITSLVPAVLLPLLGVLDGRSAATAYMNDLIFLFLGAFMLALGVERWGVHRRLALGVVGAVGAHPRRIVLGFMLASALLSMWLNNTATTLMMLPIGVAVIEAVRGRRGSSSDDPFAMALLLGLAYSASVGGVATPVGTAPNQVFLARYAADFPELPPITFAQWMLAWVPLVVLFVPVGWLLLTRVFLKVEAEGEAGADVIAAERRALGRMRPAERRMALVFGITALLWVTRADLPIGSVTIPGWHDLLGALVAPGVDLGPNMVTNATVAIGMAVVCFLVPAGDGSGARLLDWPSVMVLPWDVLLLLGGGFCIADGFKASGLDVLIGELIGPSFGVLGPTLLVLCVVAAMSFLTEVTSNTATTQVLLPVLASAAVQAGIDPRTTMLPATIAASCAFMLPVATPPNAVVFSSGRVPIHRMARVGFGVNLTLVVMITLIYQLWVRRILGIE